jgi:hypothetical protein
MSFFWAATRAVAWGDAADRDLRAEKVRLVGLPDRYVSFASRREQLTEVGLDSAHLSAALWDLIRAERHAAQAP